MIALRQEQLFNEIDILPIEIKTKIVNNINPISKSIDDLWIEEVKKRKRDIEQNRVTLIDGDEVFRKIAYRLKNNIKFNNLF